MTDIELISYYLGIEVKQLDEGIFVCQKNYIPNVLKEFNMENCQPVSTLVECKTKLSRFDDAEKVNQTLFRKLVGNLRYLIFFMELELLVILCGLQLRLP